MAIKCTCTPIYMYIYELNMYILSYTSVTKYTWLHIPSTKICNDE